MPAPSHHSAARSSARRLAGAIAVRRWRRSIGRTIGTGVVLYRPIDLFAEDPDVGGRVDAEPDLAATHLEHPHGDRITDADHLADFPCQDEHVRDSFPQPAGSARREAPTPYPRSSAATSASSFRAT